MCLFAQGSLSRIRRTNIDVRFGSKADILRCGSDVRFTPKSGHVQCTYDVRFVPIADMILRLFSPPAISNHG